MRAAEQTGILYMYSINRNTIYIFRGSYIDFFILIDFLYYNQDIGNFFLVNYKFLDFNKQFDKIKIIKKLILPLF